MGRQKDRKKEEAKLLSLLQIYICVSVRIKKDSPSYHPQLRVFPLTTIVSGLFQRLL